MKSFCFYCGQIPYLKDATLKGKNLLSRESKFFRLRGAPLGMEVNMFYARLT